jgi:alanine racemase
MQLKSRIADLRRSPEGRPVGYGCTFVPERDSLIAAIPIGYADGLSRQLSNKGVALVQGVRVPFAGRVCMDQTMLDVTIAPYAEVGDEVTLFGTSGNESIAIDEVATLANTINYEVVCAVGSRVPRIYTGETGSM